MLKVNLIPLGSRQSNEYRFIEFKKFLSSLKRKCSLFLSDCLDNPLLVLTVNTGLTGGGGSKTLPFCGWLRLLRTLHKGGFIQRIDFQRWLFFIFPTQLIVSSPNMLKFVKSCW